MQLTVTFSKPRKSFAPISWLVRTVDRIPFSHVSLTIGSSLGALIFEAAGATAHLVGPSSWEKLHVSVGSYPLNVPEQQWDICREFIRNTLEQPYSKMEFVGLGLARILGLKRVPKCMRRGYVCSTLVATALGFPEADSQDPKAVWDAITRGKV